MNEKLKIEGYQRVSGCSVKAAVALAVGGPSYQAEVKIVSSAAEVLRKAVREAEPGLKRGHFPCLDRGTGGYAQLFRQILREGFNLY